MSQIISQQQCQGLYGWFDPKAVMILGLGPLDMPYQFWDEIQSAKKWDRRLEVWWSQRCHRVHIKIRTSALHQVNMWVWKWGCIYSAQGSSVYFCKCSVSINSSWASVDLNVTRCQKVRSETWLKIWVLASLKLNLSSLRAFSAFKPYGSPRAQFLQYLFSHNIFMQSFQLWKRRILHHDNLLHQWSGTFIERWYTTLLSHSWLGEQLEMPAGGLSRCRRSRWVKFIWKLTWKDGSPCGIITQCNPQLPILRSRARTTDAWSTTSSVWSD